MLSATVELSQLRIHRSVILSQGSTLFNRGALKILYLSYYIIFYYIKMHYDVLYYTIS